MSGYSEADVNRLLDMDRAKWMAQSEKDRVRAENDRARLMERIAAAEKKEEEWALRWTDAEQARIAAVSRVEAVENERDVALAEAKTRAAANDELRVGNHQLLARAEAAEADNARLREELRGIQHVSTENGYCCPVCDQDSPGHFDFCTLGQALQGAFPPGAVLLEELRRLRGLEVAVKEYIRLYGVEHDDPDTVDGDCPQDSTCKCPHILSLKAGLAHD